MPPRFAEPDIALDHLADGSLLLRSRTPLLPYGRCLGDFLEEWAARAPQRLFLAERAPQGWRRLCYGEARQAVRAIGQALLDRGLSAERPVLILSGNGIDHALLALGAMHVGVPVVPVSVAYSRLSQDFAKLRHILSLVRPGLVFAESGAEFETPLVALDLGEAELVLGRDPPRDRRSTRRPGRRSMPPSPRSVPTPSPRSSSPPARRDCRRASSTPSACFAPTSR